ncbi:MAG: branched-chain amino acid ABC transporter permease [Syntrophorhabdales bacterium]|jgi:branched-chain amino acid transport system permease protein
MRNARSIGIALLVALLLVFVPFVSDSEKSYLVFFLFLTFCHIVLAQGWNLVAGYTGQISLGTHAFFALGAYTTAMIWRADLFGTGHYYFDPITMVLSGLVPVVFAVAIGIPLLGKLRGDYFALGTLGFGEILKVAFVKGGQFTGGPIGIVLPSTFYTSLRPHYWAALCLALLATAVVYFMSRSRLGLALVAIREDETAAASSGIHVLKYKVLAFGISAFLVGICGSIYAYYLFQVSPEGYLILSWTLYPVLMCVIGGSGTVVGPIVGSLVMTAVFSAANIYFPTVHPIFSGVIIILVMLFMPNGIVRLMERRVQGE